MKLAICFGKNFNDQRQIAEKMAKAQCVTELQNHGVYSVSKGSLACVSTSDRFSSVPLIREGADGNLLMISGVPIHSDGKLDRTLAKVIKGDYRIAARLLSSLDGAFVAVYWDNDNGKLAVVTDFLGLQPAYFLRHDGLFLMASELKGIAASGLVNIEMDPAGWGSFVSFGNTIADVTQLAGVKRMPGATILIYDPQQDLLESSTYWDWPEPSPEMTLPDVDTGQLVEFLSDDVRAYQEHYHGGTVLLSAGFDSRLNLALLERDGTDIDVLIVQNRGHYFGAEGRFAMKTARQFAHGNTRYILPSKSFFSSEDYLNYLVMNEVATPSLNLFISQVGAAISPEMKAVWQGIAPGYTLTNSHSHPPGGFEDYLGKIPVSRDSLSWRAVERVFSTSMANEMYEGFLGLLEKERRRYTDDSFGVLQFIMKNRMANRTGPNPYKVYSNMVLPFTPGVSKEYCDICLKIPYEVKANHQLYRKVFQRHFPRALKVPFCSEKGMVSLQALAPGVWIDNTLFTFVYYYKRAKTVPQIARYLSRFQGSKHDSTRKSLVGRVLSTVDPDQPELNAEGVIELINNPSMADWTCQAAQRLLFCWQAWRLIMKGELTTWNSRNFLEES